MPPQLRQLAVTVAEARGLLACDRNGLSDPFVELSARDARGARLPLAGSFSTPVARRTLSPQWRSRFSLGSASSFSLADGSARGVGGGAGFDLRLATSLRFLIYDYDALKFNDVLGEVDVPLAVVEAALSDSSAQKDGVRELDVWYKVTKVPGAMTADATGELRLIFTAVESVSASTGATGGGGNGGLVAPPPAPVALFAGAGADRPPNMLFVTVEAARGLLAMDKDTSSSDPLVKLALHGQRRETRVVRESLKPHWDETFSFLLPPAPKSAAKKAEGHAPVQLELLVEDEDRGALRNDFLGRALVPVPTAGGAHEDDEWVVTVPLLDRKLRADKPRGALRLRLQRVYDPRARRVVAAMDKKSGRSGRSGTGAGRPGMLMALQHSMRVRMAPDQEEDETDEEDEEEDAIGEEREGGADEDGGGLSAAKTDDWLMAPYLDTEPGHDGGGSAETAQETAATAGADDRFLSFVVVTVHAVEALPSMDAVVLFDSTSYASTSAWGPTCTSGSVGGAVDVYVTASVAGDESPPARTRVKSVFGAREQLRARFRDRLMVFVGDATDTSPKKPVVLTVMDWDPVGEDELVGRVELADVDALVGRAPFWINLYGAPTGSGSVSSSARGKAAADRMNERPAIGSAFRGRICVSLVLSTKRADAFEPKHQTCRIVKPLSSRLGRVAGDSSPSKASAAEPTALPVRLPWPETSVFKLRAHFVRAEGVPVLSSSLSAVALVASCGLCEVGSGARRIAATASKASGAVEWNDVVESDRFALPTASDQMPDVFLYLSYASDATGRADRADAKSRKQVEPVCFKRIPAKALLVEDVSGAVSKPVWLSLAGDRAVDKVKGRDAFPGAALVRLELLPWSDADAHPSRQDEEDGKPVTRWSSDVERLVNARAPFQVRVRVEGVRNLVRDDAGASSASSSGVSTHVVVQCGDQEAAVQLDAAASSKVVCLDLQLPPALLVAPRVLLHVRRGGEYVGSAALALFADETSGPRGVSECRKDDLATAVFPSAQWLPITADGLEDAVVGQVGAAALLVRKAFPDEALPPPTDA